MLKNISKIVLHLGWDGTVVDLAPGETVSMKSFGTTEAKEVDALEGRFMSIEQGNLEVVTAEKEAAPEEEVTAPEEEKEAGAGGGEKDANI